ncbi:hypothetical protein [Agilicoccus flavus]|uniref:hypothetical protein n=1 Tax=Agilicoccus flavus TaxID=2775968 RepID=UPI001CF68BCC|nr:hypothetical protein [Agilicoccus flavus]
MEETSAQEHAHRAVDDCFHEAGHAVAAALRASGHFDAQALTPGQYREGPAACRRWEEAPANARPFVAYAGPWAQARATWERVGALGADAAGRTFDDHVCAAVLARPQDAAAVAVAEFDVAAMLRDGGADESECRRVLRGVEFAWRRELEDVWPVVVEVALALDRGQRVALADVRRVADDRVAALYC